MAALSGIHNPACAGDGLPDPHGRLQGLLGYTSFGGIIPWIPLFLFVLLFGLSMDYHVFILSRIRALAPSPPEPDY
jgi:hypothetical protein